MRAMMNLATASVVRRLGAAVWEERPPDMNASIEFEADGAVEPVGACCASRSSFASEKSAMTGAPSSSSMTLSGFTARGGGPRLSATVGARREQAGRSSGARRAGWDW